MRPHGYLIGAALTWAALGCHGQGHAPHVAPPANENQPAAAREPRSNEPLSHRAAPVAAGSVAVEPCAPGLAENVELVTCDVPNIVALAAGDGEALLGTSDGALFRISDAERRPIELGRGLGTIQRLAVNGGDALVLDRGTPVRRNCQPNDGLCDDLLDVKPRSGRLIRVGLGAESGEPSILERALDEPLTFAATASRRYFVETHAARRVITERRTGSVRTLAEYGEEAVELVADERFVYWVTEQPATLFRTPIAGGTIERLRRVAPIRALLSTQEWLYFVFGEYGQIDTNIRRARKNPNAGELENVLDVTNFTAASADSTGVLLATETEIYALPTSGTPRRIARVPRECTASVFRAVAGNPKRYYAVTRSNCFVTGERNPP